MLLIHSENFLL
jgi:hypothetical protein